MALFLIYITLLFFFLDKYKNEFENTIISSNKNLGKVHIPIYITLLINKKKLNSHLKKKNSPSLGINTI
jgi:hypothetical protein